MSNLLELLPEETAIILPSADDLKKIFKEPASGYFIGKAQVFFEEGGLKGILKRHQERENSLLNYIHELEVKLIKAS